jgi:hypothetical protein
MAKLLSDIGGAGDGTPAYNGAIAFPSNLPALPTGKQFPFRAMVSAARSSGGRGARQHNFGKK